MKEPFIIVNGVALNEAQAMTFRVALNNFAIDLQDPDGLGSDELGNKMTAEYLKRITEINQLIFKGI